ncbi:MAG: uracil-DNA glycosylase [SAR202 cluster bacterium]|jgi:uracil-DNA glycosylase family 4|nr:uracil-DNA glycosylase [SAR202 cluster bacterium]
MNIKNPKPNDHPSLESSSDLSVFYNQMINCSLCPRIFEFRNKIAREKRKQFADWNYWGKPVPGYGDLNASLLIVGLAPAAHGGNRTGRVFTGDKSADFLMKCLHEAGLCNQPFSESLSDGLKLYDIFITPVLKCVPPQDKPTSVELRTCFKYFNKELEYLNNVKTVVALGKIAFDGCLKYFSQYQKIRKKDYSFGHNVKYKMDNGVLLLGSYHPSPRNVNTGRLTKKMMVDFFINTFEISKYENKE